MAGITYDQVGHEDEALGAAIASCAGFGRLDQPVYGFNPAVAQRAVEAVQDAVLVGFQGQGEFLKHAWPRSWPIHPTQASPSWH